MIPGRDAGVSVSCRDQNPGTGIEEWVLSDLSVTFIAGTVFTVSFYTNRVGPRSSTVRTARPLVTRSQPIEARGEGTAADPVIVDLSARQTRLRYPKVMDDYGHVVNHPGSRIPVASYRFYTDTSDFEFVAEAVDAGLSRTEIYAELTREAGRSLLIAR